MTARRGYAVRSVTMNFRLTKETLAMIDKVAKRDKRTRSETVRTLIDKALANETLLAMRDKDAS